MKYNEELPHVADGSEMIHLDSLHVKEKVGQNIYAKLQCMLDATYGYIYI